MHLYVDSFFICVWSRAALTTEVLQWQDRGKSIDDQLLSDHYLSLIYFQEILDDDVLAFRFGGRKSTANHFKRPKTVETKGTAAGTSTDLEGKGCSKSEYNQKINTGRILLSEYGVEASYYVSYDADYHAAMHHPPKNN